MGIHSRKRISIRNILLGPALSSEDAAHQAISKKVGLAVFASDTLSSVAYATQEILVVLASAVAIYGTGIYAYSIPISIAIVLLLAILTISYRQTIYAYRGGGGAYVVARDNLGELPAMIAAAALLTDYILTVAVSVSSGVEQLASVFEFIVPYRAGVSVFLVLFITVLNLRGVKESGAIFAVPTYFFVGAMVLTIGVGMFKHFTGTLGTAEQIAVEHHAAFSSIWILLILRAFSSGCTAVTGVEAISNGIQAFKDPKSKNAAQTLVVMAMLLGTMFISITFIAQWIQAVPTELPTVISQVGNVVFDGGIGYYMLVAGAIMILVMAANTSFADFPRLSALAANDGFLPRQLSIKGRRLVFSWGIAVLAGAACTLIVAFNARVTALIPLYAIGVFMSFSMSQFGMVLHWWRSSKLKVGESVRTRFGEMHFDPTWRTKIIINAVGGSVSFLVMIVFAISKFTDGAWMIVVLVPALVFLFSRIRKHYQDVARLLSMNNRMANPQKHEMLTIVFVDDVHAGTVPMVEFAMSLRHPWLAVHIDNDAAKTALIKAKWDERMRYAYHPLVIVPAPYRNITRVAIEYISKHLEKMGPKSLVHVVMGQLIMDNYLEQALHSNTTIQFKLALQQLERVVVTDVSYQLHTSDANNYPENQEGNFRKEHPELEHETHQNPAPQTTPPAADAPDVLGRAK